MNGSLSMAPQASCPLDAVALPPLRPAPTDLLDALRSPGCILDDAGRILRLNTAWMEAVEDAERYSDATWSEMFQVEDRDAAQQALSAGLASHSPPDFEARLQMREGPRWFLFSLSAMPSGGWLCTSADIHDRKRRETALQIRASIQSDMLDISVDCIKLVAPDGTLIHMNRAGCIALNVSPDSGFGMPWLPLLPEDVREAGEIALERARLGGTGRFVGRSELADGRIQHWDNMLTPVIGADGRVSTILIVSREVTAEREAIQSLQASQERLEFAVTVGKLGIWDFDIETGSLHCDARWYRIMGRDPAQPISSQDEFRSFIHPEDVDRATEVTRTAAALVRSGEDYALIFRIIRPDGDIRWVRSAAHIQHRDGVPVRAVGFITDITDARRGELSLLDANRALKAERLALQRQSLEDPLTGLPNRRHLDLRLRRLCARPGNRNMRICIGMIDVDHFKKYNDRYGHARGDEALRRVAAALRSAARASDFVARFGGEEFAFILGHTDDPSALIERFHAAVADLGIAHVGSPTGWLTISSGCVVSPTADAGSALELIEAADAALYAAKEAGRNGFVIRPSEG